MAQNNHSARMGKLQPYTSEDGTHYPQAFWCLNNFNLDINRRFLRYTYIVYSSVENYDAGRTPILGVERVYLYEGDEFDALVAANPAFVGMLLQETWAVAVATKEGPAPTEGEEDTRTSFFEEAVNA